MDEIHCESWEEFEEKVEDEYASFPDLIKKTKNLSAVSDFLFRGQELADWKLKTTPERYLEKVNDKSIKFVCESYHETLRKIQPVVNSLAGKNFNCREKFKGKFSLFGSKPQCYELMIYARHFGFPSPLLDWSKSHYVASFFAFKNARKGNVAVYSFLEVKNGRKKMGVPGPNIFGLYEDVTTDKRHFFQQSKYTTCLEGTTDGLVYSNHEDVGFGSNQDVLKKYTIPASERWKVMKKLDQMNINAFTLFGNEEGLMDMLAFREIELRENLA